MSAKAVSIVLLCRDRWTDTLRCLRSLKRHTDPRLYDLTVYDNASKDATPAGLRRLARGWPELRAVTNRRNVAFAAAVNRGARETDGRHILWLNNDTVLGPGWLEALLKAVAPDDVAAAGPMTDHMAPPLQLATGPLRGGPVTTTLLGGFCFLLKRPAAESVGPLDERFVWGWEDVDYCLRLRQAGWRLSLARGVHVRHIGNRTIDAMPAASRRRSDLANRALIQAKWPACGALGDDVRDLIRRSPAAWHPPGPIASVVVACRGGAAAVRACLDSIRRGAPPHRHEVLAVDMADDGKTSAELHRLARRRAEVKVLGPWGPMSPAQALNRAAALACGEFLAFLDDGSRPEAGWLDGLLEAAAERTEPPVVRPSDPALRDLIFLRRRSFAGAGGFDERFAGALCAEDLCLRLVQGGHVLTEHARPRVRRAARDLGPDAERDRELAARKWLEGPWNDAGFQDAFWRGTMRPERLKTVVSVAVVSRGDWARTKRCLDSVRRSAGKIAYEVLAASAGAGPRAEQELRALARRWPQLRLTGIRDDVAYPHALNLALRAARGSNLVVVADDAQIDPGCLESLLGAARSRHDAGVVTPDGHGSDACLLVPREAYLRIGEFDERFGRTYWDADFRLRAMQRGFHVVSARGASLRRSPARNGRDPAEDRRILFEKWAGHPLLPLAARR